MVKTNVMRLLDAAHIAYETGTYEVDENDLSGSHAADLMGVDHDRMYKCRLPRYLTKPRQRRNEWDMAGSDGISRVSAVFRGKSLLTNKMRII